MTELAWTQGERSAYERNGSIVDVFGAVAALDPSALAVVDEGRVVSYEDLERASNQFAQYLRSRGVLSGSRVGVAMERSIDVPCVLLGILKAGASYVPLEASQPVDRLSYIIEDVGIACVVVETLSDGDAFRGVAIVSVREDAGAIASCSATRPDVLVAADSLAYVMYTSGSTGTPKGVEIVHRGVLRLVRGADYISIARDDVFFQFAPLAFDASTFEIWGRTPQRGDACRTGKGCTFFRGGWHGSSQVRRDGAVADGTALQLDGADRATIIRESAVSSDWWRHRLSWGRGRLHPHKSTLQLSRRIRTD